MEAPARPARRAPWGRESLEAERRARAWRTGTAAAALLSSAELAYVFIDLSVFPGPGVAVARSAHLALCVGVLAWLLVRRSEVSARAVSVAFLAVVLPMLPLFAYAEVSMAANYAVWTPMLGHRLVVLGVGLFAPAGFALGSSVIGAFALEAVVLWYGLGLGGRLNMAWEPWVTLVYAAVGCAMLGFRVRSQRTEDRLRRARAEAESLERLARLFLALRDSASTPLQSLELGTALLRQRAPENAGVLDSMERALERLRGLTQRMSTADPLLVWREGEESFDAETVLRHLEESLSREVERRRQ